MVKRYFNICKKTRKVLYVFLVILFVLGILNLIIPIYASKIIDYLTVKNFDKFIKTTIVISLLFLITNLFSYFACKLYSVFFRETFINVHKMIISKLYDYNDELINIPKGKIITTVNIDAINIADMADYMFNVIFNATLILCMLIFFIKTSLILGIVFLFIVTIYIILVNILTKKSSFYMRKQRNYQDKLTNLLSQTLNGIREIKTFNMKPGLNKKYLRLYTYEVWNSDAQNFYKKHMQLEEYYTNKNDNQIDILKGKPKVFSYSLTGDKIKAWNNKYIGLDLDDEDHFKSVELMIKDDIIKEIKK